MDERMNDQLDSLIGSLLTNQVFGTPVEKHGVVLVPVAEVRGCGGVGGANGPQEGPGVDAEGSGASAAPGPQAGGGGFALAARPVGAWVIRDGDVQWRSSRNIQALATAGSVVVTALAILTTLAIRRGCCSRRGRR